MVLGGPWLFSSRSSRCVVLMGSFVVVRSQTPDVGSFEGMRKDSSSATEQDFRHCCAIV